MNADPIRSLANNFEGHAQQTEGGVDYRLARDVQHLLGYAERQNFAAVVCKKKVAGEMSGPLVADHFVEVNTMVGLGSDSPLEVEYIMLTRYAWYCCAAVLSPAA